MTVATDTDFDNAFKDFAAPEKAPDASAEAASAADEGAAAQGGDNGSGDAAAAVADGGSGDAGSAAAGDDGAGDQGSGGSGQAAESGAAGAGEAGAASADGASGDAGAVASPDNSAGEVKPAAADADDILNRLAKIVAETKPEEKPAAAQAEEQLPDLYSPEEAEFLKGYDKEWEDVARGESLKRKAEYRELLQYIFSEVGKFVAPLRETTSVLAERTHLTDLKTNVPDYSDNLRDQVVDWANKQPAYLQAAYNQVIQQGTAEEVKDLVERYRAATGQVTAQPKPKDNELSGEAKKAAAALEPVESKRSGVQAASDPSSFEDAWAQFAKSDKV